MLSRITLRAAAAGLTLMVGSATMALADTLELKNGTMASSTYAGGTATSVRFETAQGMQVYQTSDILALTFTAAVPAATPAAAIAPAAPAATAAPAPAAAPANITIPAGTPLVVRMMGGISSRNKSGTKFTTTLDADLTQAIPATKTARFFQIENQLNMLADLRVAAAMPLIK